MKENSLNLAAIYLFPTDAPTFWLPSLEMMKYEIDLAALPFSALGFTWSQRGEIDISNDPIPYLPWSSLMVGDACTRWGELGFISFSGLIHSSMPSQLQSLCYTYDAYYLLDYFCKLLLNIDIFNKWSHFKLWISISLGKQFCVLPDWKLPNGLIEDLWKSK